MSSYTRYIACRIVNASGDLIEEVNAVPGQDYMAAGNIAIGDLPSTLTNQGNTFNGPNELVQINSSGQLTIAGGITSLGVSTGNPAGVLAAQSDDANTVEMTANTGGKGSVVFNTGSTGPRIGNFNDAGVLDNDVFYVAIRYAGSYTDVATFTTAGINSVAVFPGTGFNADVAGGLYQGSGSPTTAAGMGAIYYRTDTPTVANQRIYIYTGTEWTGIV